ncbi:MAG: flippase [candidate division WOR-3 bacterium]
MTRKNLIARNAILNIVGHTLPLIIGIVVLPYIIRYLGSDRFGVLSLIWVVLAYLMFFDFGLGRATTKYTAEALGRNELTLIPSLVWTSVSIQLLIGISLSGVMLVLIPFFTERILNIPPHLIHETRAAFNIISISLPLLIASSPIRGTLEAAQRFDLVNIGVVLSGIFHFLLPLFGCLLNFDLPGIVLLLTISRIVILLLFFLFNFSIFPQIKKIRVDYRILPKLFLFGGWITLGNLVGPIIRYFDRFIIGSIIAIGAVTYYTAPFDIVERLWIIPTSLIMTLFPAFSEIAVQGDKNELKNLYLQALKYLIIVSGPVLFIFLILSDNVLQLWLGTQFVAKSNNVLRILLLASSFAILAPVPGSLLQGIGRPDIVTKIYFCELIPNFLMVYFFVKWLGINGAALNFAIRSTIETLLLFYFSSKKIGFSIQMYAENDLLKTLALTLGMGVVFFGLALFWDIFTFKILISLFLLFSSLFLTWRWLLNSHEKKTVLSTLHFIFKSRCE